MTSFRGGPAAAIVAAFLFFAPATKAAEGVEDPKVMALAAEGLDLLAANQYEEARKRFVAAQESIRANPALSNAVSSDEMQASLSLLVARAVAEGNLGDPCVSIEAAIGHANAAESKGASAAFSDEFIGIIAEATAEYRCKSGKTAPPLPDEIDAATRSKWKGHYYLSGLREVGSELLLREDGRYQWYMSYGAVDQQSDGTWAKSGNDIVLTPSKPALNQPLFSRGQMRLSIREDELRLAGERGAYRRAGAQ